MDGARWLSEADTGVQLQDSLKFASWWPRQGGVGRGPAPARSCLQGWGPRGGRAETGFNRGVLLLLSGSGEAGAVAGAGASAAWGQAVAGPCLWTAGFGGDCLALVY